MTKFFLSLCFLLTLPSFSGKLSIVTTLRVLEELTKEVGKDEVVTTSLINSSHDPHTIAERPTFKLVLKNADGFIEIGRDLEPWTKAVVASSNNQKLSKNHLVASNNIALLAVPKGLSRKAGDIHAQGNPHVWLSPLNAVKIADNIKNFLTTLRPAKSADFNKNFLAFKEKLTKAFFGEKIFEHFKNNLDFLWRLYEGARLDSYLKTKKLSLDGWLKLGQNIKYPIIAFHDTWPYFQKDFPINIIGQFEEYPGSQPSIKHINTLKNLSKEKGVKLILVESYNISKKKELERFSNDIKAKIIFIDVDCLDKENYFDFMNRILDKLKSI